MFFFLLGSLLVQQRGKSVGNGGEGKEKEDGKNWFNYKMFI